MKYDVVVVGSNMMELTTDVDRMPQLGETVAAPSFHTAFGGKGANQAYAAAQLGSKVAMVSVVGDDSFGRDYYEHFQQSGIDVRAVEVGHQANGVAPCFIQGNLNSIIVVQGANAELTPAMVDQHRDLLAQAKLIVLQQEISLATDYRVIEIANELGVPVLLNPAPANDEINYDYVRRVQFYAPNETELGRLTHLPVATLDDIKVAAHQLVADGVQNVIVTLGARGVLWVNATTELLIPAETVSAVDSIGAGDAFVGAFAHYYTAGLDIPTALQQANHYAALTVTKPGSQTSYPRADEM